MKKGGQEVCLLSLSLLAREAVQLRSLNILLNFFGIPLDSPVHALVRIVTHKSS
jgi:hypothetical protein